MNEGDRVARAYYLIAGIYTLSASLIWGINTLFLLHAGLTLFQVFVANAVFTGSMAVFEVPTGVIADVKGRRLSFLLSVAVLFAGTVFYAAIPRFGGGLAWFSAASIVLGLGYTFYSGAVEAWWWMRSGPPGARCRSTGCSRAARRCRAWQCSRAPSPAACSGRPTSHFPMSYAARSLPGRSRWRSR